MATRYTRSNCQVRVWISTLGFVMLHDSLQHLQRSKPFKNSRKTSGAKCVCVNFGLFNAGGPFWNVMISVGFLVGTLHQETHAGEKDQETRENGGGCQARKGVRLHSLAAVAQPWHFQSPWSFHGIVLVPPTRF